MDNKKTVAVVPGSFDPITYGHIDIAKRAAEKYDQVYFAVMINATKSYMFSMDERVEMAIAALADIEKVKVISYDGMLWHLCKELGAIAIVKGYRNQMDYDYEMNMAKFNAKHCPEAKTELLPCNSAFANVSSTEVRRKLESGEDLQDLIPASVIELVHEFKKRKLLS